MKIKCFQHSATVQKEATYRHFKCKHDICIGGEIPIGNQILTGLKDINTRQEALKKSRYLDNLRHERMKMERRAKSSSEIAGENCIQNRKIFLLISETKTQQVTKHSENQKITCYNCESTIQGSILQHVKDNCPARSIKCSK